MAQVKPMPVHIREYYKAMQTAYAQKKEEAYNKREALINDTYLLHDKILEHHKDYLKYNINLSEFPEFINNEYSNGEFLRMANGAYINKKENYAIVSDLYELLKLAKNQETIVKLKKDLELYDRILSIKSNEYIRYVRTFFNEVHKKMIIEGCAYHFGNHLGDVLINRVKATKGRNLDYKATKLKKAEILARGGKLYNKEEAEFCERNGLEYKAEDGRVYLQQEFFYEIFMCNATYPNARSMEFTPQAYRAVDVRGKSNQDLIKECNGDLNKICELPVDLKTKISMCNEVDKMLYTNFIRNENQTSYKYS